MLISKTKKLLSNFLIADYLMVLVTIFFLIYSLFSSNVPRILSFEHYLMLFVALLIGFIFLIEIIKSNIKQFLKNNIWSILILSFLVYGTFMGFKLNNSKDNIIRDIFGVSSILSIFLLVYFQEKNVKYLKFLFKVLVVTGFIFSIKTLIFYNFFYNSNTYPIDNPDKVSKFYFLYLENTIILSTIYFLLKMYESAEKKKFYKYIKYSFLLFFPISVIDIYALRGPILFIFITLILFICVKKKSLNGFLFSIIFFINTFFIYFFFVSYLLFYFLFNKRKKIIYSLFFIFVLLFVLDHIFLWSAELSSLTHYNFLHDHKIKKFSVYLDNNRFKEYLFIINNFNLNNLILGKGFGAIFLNPVNNSVVLFFHSFVLYYIYKLGIFGIIFLIFVFMLVFNKLIKLYLYSHLLVPSARNIYISLLGSLGYPLIFSATYKSITFGFILAFFLIFKLNYNYAKNI